MRSLIENSSKILVGGHRGGICRFAENTIEAFELAFKNGADYIETDIQLTKDYQPVIRHDLQIKVSDHEERNVFEYSYEQLRDQFSIMHADELFEWLCKNEQYRAALDIKKQPELTILESQKLIDMLIQKINDKALASQVILFSIDHELMRYTKEKAPSITTAIIVPTAPADPVELMRNTQADIYLSRVANLTQSLVQTLQDHDYLVSGGDICGDDIATAVRYGVNMFETDYPEKAKFEIAKEWARRCGEFLKKQIIEDDHVKYKTSHQDIVTSYDILIEKMIKDLIQSHYPEDHMVGEESYNNHFNLADHLWVLDPIDGTVNFVNQKRSYAISISYYHKEQPVFGIVYDVERGEMYHAYTGSGAFKNDKRLFVDAKEKRLDEMILASNIDWLVSKEEKHNWLVKLARDVRAARSYGVVSLELCWIADNYIDVYINMNTYPWDYGAGKIVLEEAGGAVKKFNNEPIMINETDGIIAAANEATIVKIIEQYL